MKSPQGRAVEERLFQHLVRKEKAYWGPFRGGARGAEEVHRALSNTIHDSIVTRRGRPLHIEGGSRGYCIDEGGGVGHGVAPNDNFANGVALALRVRWPAMSKHFRHYSQTFTPKTVDLLQLTR